MAEIIDLTEVIDLDDEPVVEKSKKKNYIARCINLKCKSRGKMQLASSFACKFYNIEITKPRKRHICEVCLDEVLNLQGVSI